MVSIIILSYNTKSILQECLTSLFSKIDKKTEVIVIDNASSDDSVAMVKTLFPQVKVVANKENAGFAKGINLGATKATGEYLLFLNSDTTITTSLLTLERNFHSNPNIAVVGGQLLYPDGKKQRSFGSFYDLRSVTTMLVRGDTGEIRRQANTKPFEVDWVSGGFMMVRRKMFEEIKGFDEHFFMYIEDMELCYRMKKKGYSIVFDPNVTVTHIGQGSSNRTFAIIHIYKGLLYFYKKHKTSQEYAILKTLLRGKAMSAICIGFLTRNNYLVDTYKKALQTI